MRSRAPPGNFLPLAASIVLERESPRPEGAMNPLMNRRMMLKQAAAASLILGFPLLASAGEPARDAVEKGVCKLPVQQSAGPSKGAPLVHRTPAGVAPLAPDEVVKRTLERAKKEKKPGVVFLYPADANSLPAVTAGLTAM